MLASPRAVRPCGPMTSIGPYGGILLLALRLLVAVYCKPVRGVEDAAPYTLARPCATVEESAAGSRQTNLC